MTDTQKSIIVVEHAFGFPIEIVFDAWLDPENAWNWLFATPEGEMQRVEINPVVGGDFFVKERRLEGNAEHYGKYLRILPHRLLEFSFSVEESNPNPDIVKLEFVSTENGCNVTLTDSMDARFEEFADRARAGWFSILEGLDATLKRLHPSDIA
jgi:uncharacterized protein YndB with AHSA1/START domain